MSDRTDFRSLFEELRDQAWYGTRDDPAPVAAILEAWAAAPWVLATMDSLAAFREVPALAPPWTLSRGWADLAEPETALPSQGLWELYALSRVSDLLLTAFQGREGERPSPPIPAELYVGFFEALGCEAFGERAYSPFFHEIVEVEPSDDPDGGVEIVRQFWPGLLFGCLLFARAGVRVRCHPIIMRKEIAETSTLYFTYIRERRPTSDLSMGWGSNSQWATEFRCDYLDGDRYHFNVEGRIDISVPEPASLGRLDNGQLRLRHEELSVEARRELLVNRCLVTIPEPGPAGYLTPHYDRLTVHRDDPLVSFPPRPHDRTSASASPPS